MIILASASPRRKEIMQKYSYEIEVIPSNCEETVQDGLSPGQTARSLAEQKAKDVARSHPDDIVIGADTIVALDGEILGKPSSRDDAKKALQKLSGKTHEVITGVAIISGTEQEVYSAVTKVKFYPISDEEIDEYIRTGEPMDKAGSYGIQGKGGLFVEKIDGDYENVVGLPTASLSRKLKRFTNN